MKRLLIIGLLVTCGLTVNAQSPLRRQQMQQHSSANTISTRAQISFPTTAPMKEDVVWRRDIYRELNLINDANSGLYYPVEPVGSQMNLFTYIFKLMMMGPNRGGVAAYQYRMDGNEVYDDSARIKPLQFLDNYHIFYERTDKGIRLDNSDIPSSEVKGYYLKESAYYDQSSGTFHRKVIALCPIMYRADDFGDNEVKYPLFWVKYDDLAPFLSKQIIMTSNLNNAATMSVDDYFTMNMYKGKIYKTGNMLGRTLSQYCPTDSLMAKEQKKIETELNDFEKGIYGNHPDTVQVKDEYSEVKRRGRSARRGEGLSESTTKVRRSRSTRRSNGSSTSSGTLTVRRDRH